MPLPIERYPLTLEQRTQLDEDLVCVEDRLEAITALMRACNGDDSPLVTRAGDVADALQRLKWEIGRTEQGKQAAAD